MNKKVLIIAALLTVVVSAAFACPDLAHSVSYTFCRRIALVGLPGVYVAVVVSMVLLGGAHGGGPIGMLLLIATPINFLLYVALAVVARRLLHLFRKRRNKST